MNGVLDNGVLVGTIPASQLNSSVNVNIGRRLAGYYFNGIIDEVRIYNRALSQSEIQTDMNNPIAAPTPTATVTPTTDTLHLRTTLYAYGNTDINTGIDQNIRPGFLLLKSNSRSSAKCNAHPNW